MNNSSAISHLENDAIFKKLINSVELEYRAPRGSLYQSLMRAIVGQQLSVKAASTIHKRFVSLYPNEYPDPNLVINSSLEDLRSVGLSAQKSGYVQNVALFFKKNKLLNFDWSNLGDEEVISKLTEIKGVGRWTVEMILMFTLKRPDVFPLDDLGIQNAMKALYSLQGTKKEIKLQMLEVAKNWQPYRTLACEYLWAWKDDKVMD